VETDAALSSQAELQGTNMDQPIQGVNKRQAVAEALRELGQEAGSQEVAAFTQARFGLVVDPGDLTTFRGERRRRREEDTSPLPWHQDPYHDAASPDSMTEEPGASPHTGEASTPRGRPRKQAEATTQEPEAQGTEQGNGEAISKLEAMRRSLAELGNDAKPLTRQEHLRKKYSIDMDPSYISKYKSLVLTTAKKRKVSKPKAVAATVVVVAPLPTSTGGISLDDLRALKGLGDRLGADKVCELVGLLAK
jgi:hypothetical protein